MAYQTDNSTRERRQQKQLCRSIKIAFIRRNEVFQYKYFKNIR